MNKKVAITGHTSGIGKALFDRLIPNAIGFSRSNGYNIQDSKDRTRIIKESANCDIFINNAHAGFGQTYLAIDLFREWKDKTKTVVNVGSKIAERFTLPDDKLDLLNYQAEKITLKEMSIRLNSPTCKVHYRWFGYVGTETILIKYPNFTPSDYITVDQAVDIILKDII
jgi:hypothetical protein